MRSNISQDIIDEYSGKSVQPVLMAELFFDSGTLRLWTGYGEIQWNGNTFFGSGNTLGITIIEETQDTQAKGIVFTMNGIPSTLIAIALGERSRGRRFILYMGMASSESRVATEDEPGVVLLEDSGVVLLENELSGDPYRIFSGLMDIIEFSDDGETAALRLSVENALIIGQRPKTKRYTSEDQKKVYPIDRGFDLINQLQDKEVVW